MTDEEKPEKNNVIYLDKKRPPPKKVVELVNFSNDLDFVIKKYLEKNAKPVELAGVISIVLGKFLRNFDKKEKITEYIINKIKKHSQ